MNGRTQMMAGPLPAGASVRPQRPRQKPRLTKVTVLDARNPGDLSRHGTEVRLTPSPSEGDSCAVGRSAMPLTTRIESRNTRHASPSGLGRNRRNLFPSLSPWFVNLDSEPCIRPPETPLDEPGWRGIYTEYVSLSNIKCILYSKKCYRVHEIPGRFHGQAPSPGGRRDSRDRPMG